MVEKHQRHFQDELELLKARLLEMGGLSEERVRLAMRALVERDIRLVDDAPLPTTPIAPGITEADVLHAIRHEGALTTDDVLDRRTRTGLVPQDRAKAEPEIATILADA